MDTFTLKNPNFLIGDNERKREGEREGGKEN